MKLHPAHIIFFAALIFISGCEYDRVITDYRTECLHSDSEKLQAFVLECIKNANPKSDEEPEDYIRQCQWTAEKIICREFKVVLHQKCAGDHCRTAKKVIHK